MIVWHKNSVTITDCYELSLDQIHRIVFRIKTSMYCPDCLVNRSAEDLENEIIAHKVLYKLHIKRDHTKDCDLDQEPKFRRAIY